MEIDINQTKFSIGDSYQIFVEGQQTHKASTRLFSWLTEINLFEVGSAQPTYRIKKKWTFFNTSFDLIKWDNTVSAFRTKSTWENHYFCRVGIDRYEIFGHTGRKYSIYKNKKQIAWWDKEPVSWFNGDNYKIIADYNVDFELLIAFCLIIDNTHSNDNDATIVSIDFGNIGSQVKKFDDRWKPKIQ